MSLMCVNIVFFSKSLLNVLFLISIKHREILQRRFLVVEIDLF